VPSFTFGQRCQVAESGVALQHVILRRPHHADLEEVIHHPQAVEADVVDEARDFRQFAGGGYYSTAVAVRGVALNNKRNRRIIR
jgi:erythromycin esterase-like protein